jgi:hypothetical protein
MDFAGVPEHALYLGHSGHGTSALEENVSLNRAYCNEEVRNGIKGNSFSIRIS